MSVLPSRLEAMLEQSLVGVKNSEQQKDLRLVANVVAAATWQHWQAWRPLEDNRPEHEWMVFANLMKIAESEGLNLSERRIATAFTFTHDTFCIPRITEAMIRAVDIEISNVEQFEPNRASQLRNHAAQLREAKAQQRQTHMEGGARNAEFILSQLKHPDHLSELLLTREEIDRCIDIIAKHDLWKISTPYPLSSDLLAVVCFEADALWPLHPLGVLADLERPDTDGNTKDANDPAEWHKQVQENLKTLLEYRSNWKDVEGEIFVDNESIFRTKEGYRLFREWRRFWNI